MSKYDKRRFIEAASMTMCHAILMSGKKPDSRVVVNTAHELWDEIETQCPSDEEKGS